MDSKLNWVSQEPLKTAGDSGTQYRSKGYAFDRAGNCLIGYEIGEFLSQSTAGIQECIHELNGCFACVLHQNHNILLVTDRFGTIPVYVLIHGDQLYASSNVWDIIRAQPEAPVLDEIGIIDMVRLGYVAGTRTLIKGIRTLAPGHIARFKNQQLVSTSYWHYDYEPASTENSDLEADLRRALISAIQRSCSVHNRIGGRLSVVLSGGLDSRLLAGLVTSEASGPYDCISYGIKNDPEVSTAQQIAQALNTDHSIYPIDSTYLNDEFISQSVREVGITTRFTCGIGARHMRASGSDMVMPGHSGDFIAGSWLTKPTLLISHSNHLRNLLYFKHYTNDIPESAYGQLLELDWKGLKWKSLDETLEHIDPVSEFWGAYDRWNIENRQRNLILMELRAYEQTSKWLLPFFDYELIDFFRTIPHRLRFNQFLYRKTVIEQIFIDKLHELQAIPRVGGELTVGREADFQRYRELFKGLKPFAGLITAILPTVRRVRNSMKPFKTTQWGPDPITHWFHTNPKAQDYIVSKVDSLRIEHVKKLYLKKLLVRKAPYHGLYETVIPAVLTIQEIADQARLEWKKGRDLG